MKFRYAKKSWRDLLPTVFSWLDKVSFEKHMKVLKEQLIMWFHIF